jgi:hypothetical protein
MHDINRDALIELVSIDGNGIHVLYDFTSDTEVLIAALKKVGSKLDAMAGNDTETIGQATANPNPAAGARPARIQNYSSDFGSEWFLGLFLSRCVTNSWAQTGVFTFPSRMMSSALTF